VKKRFPPLESKGGGFFYFLLDKNTEASVAKNQVTDYSSMHSTLEK